MARSGLPAIVAAMLPIRLALLAAAALLATAASASADPISFFVGHTESAGTMKVMMKKPYRVFNHGQGRLDSDGTLILVQQVEDEGQPSHQRTWRIRQTGPGRFSGTMTEAEGLVDIQETGGRYRFRFKMKGGLSVEQWIIPIGDGSSVRNNIVVKKLGLTVASGESVIRKAS